ncbi:uncharacterized protein Bfra_008316 [Botrytis fragariae]|uniref:Uncharacterized protein n=1 Tax=Botrytis fragariae TaxID=1964551 RepID=A0A8H6ASV7_9HELO|nr:uncharacterized protein Bfra_008316 [Botrytis fragariae]KAF5873039.1 hypothetical protein Bfra_008316 [Botrytis fragariae]
MTIHTPNPAQNIYNAPTQPAYALQSGNRNRTIPIPLDQAQGSVHGSADMGGAVGTQLGSAQNVNVSGSGGVVASARAASGQSAARAAIQGRNLKKGCGNRGGSGGGTSRNVSAGLGMYAQAQPQAQGQAQNLHTPVNYVHPYVHPQAHHLQAHHPQAHNPHPHNPMNHIQPLVGGVFGPHTPHIPRAGRVLPPLGPYIPRTGGARFPTRNLGGNRPAYGPLQPLPGLPVPFGYPQVGNENARRMGFGNGGMNVIVNGWDSRWDGSGGDRGRGAGPRGGRGRRRR